MFQMPVYHKPDFTKPQFTEAPDNALATHDLEGAHLRTALGQNIYTQKSVPNGHLTIWM